MPTRGVTRRKLTTAIAAIPVATAGCFGGDTGTTDGYTVEIVDRDTDERVADYHGHWHGELPSVPIGAHVSLGAIVETDDGSEFSLGDEYRFDARPADGSAELLTAESHGDHVHLGGEAAGEAAVFFRLLDGDRTEWESSEPIPVDVTVS